MVNWYRKESLPASGVMEMPDESGEIKFVVKLCDDREGQSTLYNIAVLVSLVFSGISEFSASGWSWLNIITITICSIYIILGVFSVVSDVFSWFRSRASYKKIMKQTLSSEEMKDAINEFSKHNKEISKDFSFGKTYKVYCLEKANAI